MRAHHKTGLLLFCVGTAVLCASLGFTVWSLRVKWAAGTDPQWFPIAVFTWLMGEGCALCGCILMQCKCEWKRRFTSVSIVLWEASLAVSFLAFWSTVFTGSNAAWNAHAVVIALALPVIAQYAADAARERKRAL